MITDWWHVVSEPGHILAEATFVAVEILVARPILKLWLKRHDRTHECKHDDL